MWSDSCRIWSEFSWGQEYCGSLRQILPRGFQHFFLEEWHWSLWSPWDGNGSQAVVGLIVNPVNSVVPAMCEMWKKKGSETQSASRFYVRTWDVMWWYVMWREDSLLLQHLPNLQAWILQRLSELEAYLVQKSAWQLPIQGMITITILLSISWPLVSCEICWLAEITTLDVVRADKFVHEMTGSPMSDVSVPVIGTLAKLSLQMTIHRCYHRVVCCKTLFFCQISANLCNAQEAMLAQQFCRCSLSARHRNCNRNR